MCVIMLVQDSRPSKHLIDKAFDENPDGGGVAWREGKGKDRVVKWRKGLTREEMYEAIADLPMPMIAHFRKKSVGEKKPQMCHPFEISQVTNLELEGSTKGAVFFHNGTVDRWEAEVKDVCLKTGKFLPAGKWTDTRALAWIASVAGYGYIEIMKAKGVAFGAREDDFEVFSGDGINGSGPWTKVDDIWCSNDKFVREVKGAGHHQSYPIKEADTGKGERPTTKYIFCRVVSCLKKRGVDGIVLDDDGYCPDHTKKKSPPTPQSSTPIVTPTSENSTSSTVSPTKDKAKVVTVHPNGDRVVEGFGRIKNRHFKDIPSPCQEVVNESREVARTKGPFAAMQFIKLKFYTQELSRAQYKKLTAQFDRQIEKITSEARKLREAELAAVFNQESPTPTITTRPTA